MKTKLLTFLTIPFLTFTFVLIYRNEWNLLHERTDDNTNEMWKLLKPGTTVENSALSDRKLANNWPDWTYKSVLQPWIIPPANTTGGSPDARTATKRLPTVIGIGVRKCGTTALQKFMSVHPQFAHTEGEAHFFDSRSYFEGLKAYLNMMPESTPDQVVFEKSPRYFFTPPVPNRIRDWNPNVKLIAVICDPVPRAFSDYHFLQSSEVVYRKKWVSKFKSFESHINSAMSDVMKIYENPRDTLGYATFESFVRNSWNERTFQLTILTHGMYYYHLMSWYNYFPPSQIHIVDGENFIKNPVVELKKVEKYLGMDDVINDNLFRYDSSKGFYCITNVGCLRKTKGVTRQNDGPEIPVDIKQNLSLFFKPFNQKLFKLLGREFDWT